MINNIGNYYWAGYKAGQACKNKDMSKMKFEIDYANRMMRLETGQDKIDANTEMCKGYKEGKNA